MQHTPSSIRSLLLPRPSLLLGGDCERNIPDRLHVVDEKVQGSAGLLTGWLLERLLNSTCPALTLFLTPRMVPFLLQMLILCLLNSLSLLALAYKSRSSGSQPLSSWATRRPVRWLLASGGRGLSGSVPVLLPCSEAAESDREAHQAASSLNTSANTRPLLAAATRNLTVFPAFSFSFFHRGSSIVRQDFFSTWLSLDELRVAMRHDQTVIFPLMCQNELKGP